MFREKRLSTEKRSVNLFVKTEANGVVERIRLLLARFPENEESVRRLAATDPSFDALCHEYGKVIELLDRFEVEVKQLRKIMETLGRSEAEVERLTQLRTSLEEELLTRIEGHQPQ